MAKDFDVYKKRKNFTIIDNGIFKNKEMSLKAKGLLCLMLSLPAEWDYSINGLVKLSKDGRDSVNGALKELERFGYLIRTQKQSETGQFTGYKYSVFEEPQEIKEEKPNTEEPFTEKPFTEKPFTENPYTENPQQYNTNNINNENNKVINNKEERKKESNSRSFDEIINSMIENEKVKETIYEFIKMRVMIKKKLTDFALKKLINKLFNFSKEPTIQVKILEQSIINSWQDIYELKNTNNKIINNKEQLKISDEVKGLGDNFKPGSVKTKDYTKEVLEF